MGGQAPVQPVDCPQKDTCFHLLLISFLKTSILKSLILAEASRHSTTVRGQTRVPHSERVVWAQICEQILRAFGTAGRKSRAFADPLGRVGWAPLVYTCPPTHLHSISYDCNSFSTLCLIKAHFFCSPHCPHISHILSDQQILDERKTFPSSSSRWDWGRGEMSLSACWVCSLTRTHCSQSFPSPSDRWETDVLRDKA